MRQPFASTTYNQNHHIVILIYQNVNVYKIEGGEEEELAETFI